MSLPLYHYILSVNQRRILSTVLSRLEKYLSDVPEFTHQKEKKKKERKAKQTDEQKASWLRLDTVPELRGSSNLPPW